MGIHMIAPLYEKVIKPGWGPIQETIYPALSYDGYLATWKGSPHDTYPLNWAADEGLVVDWDTSLSLYNHDYLGTASVYRGVLFFNTGALPANAWLLSAYVRVSVPTLVNCRSALLCLTPATNVHTPLVASDYSALLETPSIIGSYPLDDITPPDVFNIEITLEGLEAITKAGITRFGARIGYEIEADPCSICYEGLQLTLTEHHLQWYRPWITITYRLPL